MYDYSKLLGRIREKGLTLEQISRGIGINASTFSGKLHGKSEFRQGEILAICREIDADAEAIEKLFFTQKLPKTKVN